MYLPYIIQLVCKYTSEFQPHSDPYILQNNLKRYLTSLISLQGAAMEKGEQVAETHKIPNGITTQKHMNGEY